MKYTTVNSDVFAQVDLIQMLHILAAIFSRDCPDSAICNACAFIAQTHRTAWRVAESSSLQQCSPLYSAATVPKLPHGCKLLQ